MIRSRKSVISGFILAMAMGWSMSVSAQDSTIAAIKPSVAVLTPTVGENVSEYSSGQLDDKLGLLQEELEKSLLAIRKFNVVTRSKEKMEAIDQEQDFSASSMSSGNAAHKGGMDAVHYLIKPAINDFIYARSSTPVPNIDNKYFRRDSGKIGIYVDVLDTTSGHIKNSFYLKSSFSTDRKVVNSRKGSPSNSHFLKMATDVGDQLTEQILNTVFPILAIKVEGERVWLNRGNDGGLKAGDMLDIYRPGETLIDPYTGENIGSAETLVGKLAIERVSPKFTTGIIQAGDDGQLHSVQNGYIFRTPSQGE